MIHVQEAVEGLQQVARHLVNASQEINLAGAALVKVTSVALAAVEPALAAQQDLREQADRLEGLVVDIQARMADIQRRLPEKPA